MKILLLIRHAKSSWNDTSLRDIDRPLNARGKQDASDMGKRLKHKKITIDLFVASPAKRAKKTAILFMNELGAKEDELVLIDELYEAHIENYENVIKNLPDKKDTIALFAHNPGITDFINSLDIAPLPDIPTCGIYAIAVDTNHWSDFKNSKKDFLFFDYPKMP